MSEHKWLILAGFHADDGQAFAFHENADLPEMVDDDGDHYVAVCHAHSAVGCMRCGLPYAVARHYDCDPEKSDEIMERVNDDTLDKDHLTPRESYFMGQFIELAARAIHIHDLVIVPDAPPEDL